MLLFKNRKEGRNKEFCIMFLQKYNDGIILLSQGRLTYRNVEMYLIKFTLDPFFNSQVFLLLHLNTEGLVMLCNDV